MLTDLNIRNFAIIDRLHVSFGPGFNVLSGETGAGKSILLGAVGILLGARARGDDIRTGEDEAQVEGLFEVDEHIASELRPLLEEFGLDFDGEEILIRRIVHRTGKNRVFLNGSLVTLGQLQPVAEKLVTIYGQHEQQNLLKTDNHLAALDEFAGNEELLGRYRRSYARLQQAREHLSGLETDERERRQRIDLLSFQSQEIASANLQQGEEEELESERRMLLNAEKLASATQGGFERLYGEDGAACERIDQVAGALEELAEVDARLGDLAAELRTTLYSLEDVSHQLRGYADDLTFEPQRQEEVEGRLAVLAGLKRKYGSSVEAVLGYREEIDQELARLANIDEARIEAQEEIARLEDDVVNLGEKLTQSRHEAARRLEKGVEKELSDLAMAQARFQIRLQTLMEAGPAGLEKAQFYLSSNPGEEVRPLTRIASGGELSRIMLALKRAAPGEDTQTLIFDEVDAGIGGMTATQVGEKLRSLARGRQVLCVTHLPQVAAFAERQYLIAKVEEQGRTRTAVSLLDNEARIHEMARMLGGARITDRTLEHARELIHQSASGS